MKTIKTIRTHKSNHSERRKFEKEEIENKMLTAIRRQWAATHTIERSTEKDVSERVVLFSI